MESILDDLIKELVTKYKNFKGITNNKLDGALSFVVETTVYRILDYCNLDLTEWPIGLNNTVVLIVDQFMDAENIGKTEKEISDQSVKSVKTGDVTVTRETAAERSKSMLTNKSLLNDHRRSLNRYRKLR